MPLNTLELFAVIVVTAWVAVAFAWFLFRATQDWWQEGGEGEGGEEQ